MLLIKLIIVSVLCLLNFTSSAVVEKTQLAQVTQEKHNNKKDTAPFMAPTTQSNIYRIKRLNFSKDKPKLRKQQQQHHHQRIEGHVDRQLHQHEHESLIQQDASHYPNESKEMLLNKFKADARLSNKSKIKKVKGGGKNSHSLNKKLLNKLGFTKVKAPNSHNRKRLAIESRRHASPDDSHMFIIKLPPNMYYYANPKPSSGSGSPNAITSSSSLPSMNVKSALKLQPQQQQEHHQQQQQQHHQLQLLKDDSTKDANGKQVNFDTYRKTSALRYNPFVVNLTFDGCKLMENLSRVPVMKMIFESLKDNTNVNHTCPYNVSFPFNSNGKPGRIYHWNLPVIKKMLEDQQQRFPSVANVDPNKVHDLIDIQNIPTWSKPWENESIEKSYNQDTMMSYKKSLKRKSPSYYAPANTVNKNSFNKYFSGNGKPKGFYVIKENQKKPLYYKNIVA